MQPASQATCKCSRSAAETRPSLRALRPQSDDDEEPFSDGEEDEVFDPRFAELWEPSELEDDEAEPEHGDFWPELEDAEP
ncbi:MAG TPA: hypothetical protein VL175_21095 [Pirellulales bacterium]|jgi:hypothetical protein|nr:hypothetical protein [Pirellulales bacterium]